MPELPDLVYIEDELAQQLTGRRIESVDIKDPIVIRCLIDSAFEEQLVNRTVEAIYRHGPFLVFDLDDDLKIIIHPMLAGRFKLTAADAACGRDLSFKLHFDNAKTLSYLDDKRMGKVYLLRADQAGQIPRFNNQGIDLLSTDFTRKAFIDAIEKQRKQVRVFLMDQSLLSAIGNAYADEILYDAGIHPKTFCYQLCDDEKQTLFKSIRKVLHWGIAEVSRAKQPIDVKVRDHMRVRNRKNQPCPQCGTTIRRAGVLGHDTFFCPKCQPAKRSQFISWDK